MGKYYSESEITRARSPKFLLRLQEVLSLKNLRIRYLFQDICTDHSPSLKKFLPKIPQRVSSTLRFHFLCSISSLSSFLAESAIHILPPCLIYFAYCCVVLKIHLVDCSPSVLHRHRRVLQAGNLSVLLIG